MFTTSKIKKEPSSLLFTAPVKNKRRSLQELITMLPLIDSNNSKNKFKDKNATDCHTKSVLFGTGICSTKSLSRGLPFDALSMITTAIYFYRNLSYKKIIQFIPDTTALVNDFVDTKDAMAVRDLYKTSVRNAIDKLDFDCDFQIICASDYHDSDKFKDIYHTIYAQLSETEKGLPKPVLLYLTEQLADMRYLHLYHDVGLKVSWLLNPKDKKIRVDERFFDSKYREIFGDNEIAMVYTFSGRNFDEKRFRVCPYTSIPGEKRLLLTSPESAQEFLNNIKITSKSFKSTLAHLLTVQSQFEKIVGYECSGETLGEKIDQIKYLFKNSSPKQKPKIS